MIQSVLRELIVIYNFLDINHNLIIFGVTSMVAGKLQKKHRTINVITLGSGSLGKPVQELTSKEIHKTLRRVSRKEPNKKVTLKPRIPLRKLKKGIVVFRVHTFPYEPTANQGREWIDTLTLITRPFKMTSVGPFIGCTELVKDFGVNKDSAGTQRADTFSLHDSNIIHNSYNFHRTFLTLKNAKLYHLRMTSPAKLSMTSHEKMQDILDQKERWAFLDELEYESDYMDREEEELSEAEAEAEDWLAQEEHLDKLVDDHFAMPTNAPPSPAMSNAFRAALK